MDEFDVAIVSVVPSPYQRDLFEALAARPEVRLRVYYLEQSAPDSPWPIRTLASYESILGAPWFAVAGARFHVVWRHPSLRGYQFLILNTLTSTLSQMKLRLPHSPGKKIFWAEPLRAQTGKVRQSVQHLLSAPIKRADAIVAIGSEAVQSYRRLFPGQQVFNIPYHCDLQSFLQADRASAERLTFLFCGQMIRRKGVDVLIAAFQKLVDEGIAADLLLVGREAELPEMLAATNQATRARIRYEGFFDPAKLSDVFARASVFILPSRYDGWGVVVNQAIGAGLPVICSEAVGAGHDLVRPGINGFRVQPDDVERLAEAMRFFAKDPEAVVRFGNASRTLAQEWTPAKGAEKWVSVFRSLAKA